MSLVLVQGKLYHLESLVSVTLSEKNILLSTFLLKNFLVRYLPYHLELHGNKY